MTDTPDDLGYLTAPPENEEGPTPERWVSHFSFGLGDVDFLDQNEVDQILGKKPEDRANAENTPEGNRGDSA